MAAVIFSTIFFFASGRMPGGASINSTGILLSSHIMNSPMARQVLHGQQWDVLVHSQAEQATVKNRACQRRVANRCIAPRLINEDESEIKYKAGPGRKLDRVRPCIAIVLS